MSATQAQRFPFGQTLAVAHRTLTEPLRATLAKEGTPTSTWYVMRLIAMHGPAVERSFLVHELGAMATEVGHAAAPGVVEQLLADGVVAVDGDDQVTLTPQGDARFAELTEVVAACTRQVLGSVDPTDLATTERILRELTEHARKITC